MMRSVFICLAGGKVKTIIKSKHNGVNMIQLVNKVTPEMHMCCSCTLHT